MIDQLNFLKEKKMQNTNNDAKILASFTKSNVWVTVSSGDAGIIFGSLLAWDQNMHRMKNKNEFHHTEFQFSNYR